MFSLVTIDFGLYNFPCFRDKSTKSHLKNVYACVTMEIIVAALGAAINCYLKSSVSYLSAIILKMKFSIIVLAHISKVFVPDLFALQIY